MVSSIFSSGTRIPVQKGMTSNRPTFYIKSLLEMYCCLLLFRPSSTWPLSVTHYSSEVPSSHNIKEQLSKYGLGTPTPRTLTGSLKSNYFITILRYIFSPDSHSLRSVTMFSRPYMMCNTVPTANCKCYCVQNFSV